jgi:DNA polymerase phi
VSFTDVPVGQSCVDSALRLFPISSRKPDSQGDRDVQQVHLEPIDVLVDIIIGYLEKGTAFLRAVGNRSFSLLSGVAGESTVNLILTVSDSRSVS